MKLKLKKYGYPTASITTRCNIINIVIIIIFYSINTGITCVFVLWLHCIGIHSSIDISISIINMTVLWVELSWAVVYLKYAVSFRSIDSLMVGV